MTSWDVTRIRDLLIDAGGIALSHFDTPETELKHDQSLVTVADKAIEEYLRSRLTGDDDGAILLGEESSGGWTQEGVDAARAGIAWIVDPIDGTAPYANGLPSWGISVGLMERGELTNGALFLPRTGEMFITSGEQVLFEEGPRDPEHWRFDALKPIGAPPRTYTVSGMVSLPREVINRGVFSAANPVQAVGSAVYTAAKLVRGSYIAYVSRINLWDVAGALPILDRLGFQTARMDGGPVTTRIDEDNWILDAAHPRLWKCRDLLLTAADDETFAVIRKHYRSTR